MKQELEKVTQERDEFNKKLTKLQHKEGQFQREVRSRDLQIQKLQESLRSKMIEKTGVAPK